MKQVKRFIIGYRLKGVPVTEVKTLFIAHYSMEQAQALFDEYASLKGLNLDFVTCVQAKGKSKGIVNYDAKYVQDEEDYIKALRKAKEGAKA